MSERRSRPPPARPDLDALIEASRNHVMTKEEMAAQRKSWVVGELMLSNESLTRAEAERIYDDACRGFPAERK